MSDDRGTFDIHCSGCGKYLFSGEWPRPFSVGDEHLLKKKHFCLKCKKEKGRAKCK